MKSTFQFLLCLFCLWALPNAANAQCSWGFTYTTDSSRCVASGKISVFINGPDAGNVTNQLYSLKAVNGSYEVSHSSTPLFENLPAGEYQVRARGICGGVEDSVVHNVIVPGNYILFSGQAAAIRASFADCPTGQAELRFANGRKGYKAVITSKPAGYTGNLDFTSWNDTLVISDLVAGEYQFALTDSCASTSIVQRVVIAALPTVTASLLALYDRNVLRGQGCDRIIAGGPFDVPVEYLPYFNQQSSWTFAVELEGEAKTEYKPVHSSTAFELQLPVGKTFKDYYSKLIRYYFKPPCGEETVIAVRIWGPTFSVEHQSNCNQDINLVYNSYSSLTCYPMYYTIENVGTGQVYRDTAYDNSSKVLNNIPFGQYSFKAETPDGWASVPFLRTYEPLSGKMYQMGFHTDPYGQNGYASLAVSCLHGLQFQAGTQLELLAPAGKRFSYTMIWGGGQTTFFGVDNDNKLFEPGNYVLKITDRCGVYYDTVLLRNTDVYRYDFSVESRDSCAGDKVTVNGIVTFHEEELPMYYYITRGPEGYSPSYAVYPAGSFVTLSQEGEYEISVSATPFGAYVNGTKSNVLYYSYKRNPLLIDVKRTSGWICPGAVANSGAIQVYVQNPRTNYNYKYKLALPGHGASGPYLDANSTGRFTSGGGYQLMVNQNYDVRVENECGEFAVQTVKIIDFATAQLASLNKPAFCVGDMAQFRVINLPGSANSYNWTGPYRFESHYPSPVIRGLKPPHAGDYIVVINSDICSAPIRDTVTLTLADYELSCFSAVTDTSVNPYTAGILGNWRPHKTYAYYGERRESDPTAATNIRRDGAYKDFMSFWKKQTNGWKAQPDTTRWVWNAESTLFNKKGFELENRDALNRYNSAVYAFEDALPIAVAQNARYRESAYEGFEDFYFKGNDCETGDCPPGRRFDFSRYMPWLDSTQHHTGRYSLKIPAGDTLQTSHETADQAAVAGKPIFEMQTSTCLPATVLKKVKADASMVLPPFSPLNGKKVLFSAWVKEAADCQCAAYEKNVVQLIVKQGVQAFLHESKPSGNIIEGWQRYEAVVDLPEGSSRLSVMIIAKGDVPVYVDDIRIHPFNANMKSYAYDPQTLRMMAELDENNYATFFEYDDDGGLTRVKKETERGIKTIKETRSALVKE